MHVFDERGAHDFVWLHARAPFDVCVYELADTPASAFVWPYLLHYPGIVRLRDASLRASRGTALLTSRRTHDYAEEMRVSGRRMLHVPLRASRMTVVADAAVARTLQDEYPGVPVRHAPIGMAGIEPDPVRSAGPVTFAVLDPSVEDSVGRAAQRARDAGAVFEVRTYSSAIAAAREADVLVAMRWPPRAEPPAAALLGMSAGRPVIVYEVETTAAWPALDPQTWERRGAAAPAIVVSIDPRDEEHSLVLSIRRLASSPALREQLGRAAQAWWGTQATPAHAAAAWEPLLREAAALDVPPRPPDWPAHLTADGTARAREILGEFGVSVEFID